MAEEAEIEERRQIEAAALDCYPAGLGYRLTDRGWLPDPAAGPFHSPPCPPDGCDLHFVTCPRRALDLRMEARS